MALNTIQSLDTSSGLADLIRRLKGVDSFYDEGAQAAPGIRELIRSELAEDPRLKDIKLRVTPGLHGAYAPSKDTVALGVVNPAVVGHELGHAKNLRQSKVYGKLLQATNAVAGLNRAAALPAMLAIRALVKDKDTRNEVFNILTGASAALAAPGLAEELSASVDAVKHAPDKLQAVKSLLPAFLHHTLSASMPIGVYQLGKHI